MAEKEKEEIIEDGYILKNVVTQTELGIGKADDESILSDKELLLLLINKIDRIEKAVV